MCEKNRSCIPPPGRPEHRDEIGFQVNGLSHMIKWLAHQYGGRDGEPSGVGIYGWLIGFLYDNRDQDIFQRDLQKQFAVRRSSMTGILQSMERDGMIIRHPVPWDARLKKIVLTEKAVQRHEKFRQAIAEIEAKLSAGLTAEEKATFIALCEKIAKAIRPEQGGTH